VSARTSMKRASPPASNIVSGDVVFSRRRLGNAWPAALLPVPARLTFGFGFVGVRRSARPRRPTAGGGGEAERDVRSTAGGGGVWGVGAAGGGAGAAGGGETRVVVGRAGAGFAPGRGSGTGPVVRPGAGSGAGPPPAAAPARSAPAQQKTATIDASRGSDRPKHFIQASPALCFRPLV
jgi:hypothetical protein